MEQLSDIEVIQRGLARFPWQGDRVTAWRLRAEERYIAPHDYDPTATEFPPPWDSVADAPPEVLAGLAKAFREILNEQPD